MTSRERAALWAAGIIGPWYLKDHQVDAYMLCKRERFPFIEKSRRIGKTTGTLVHMQEFLRQGEAKIVRWCEPWKYQAREIVIPEMERLQETCPSKLKFKYYKTDSFFELPTNGARMYLRGVNEDKGESARGSFAHAIVADEYGSWREAAYIVSEVLLAQLLSTNGQLIKTSTPPRDLGHLYYEERELAARENRFIQKIIWDAESHLFTRDQIIEMCHAVGGPESPAWRREFLCQPVSDPELLIIPEWRDEENIVDDDYPMPEFVTRYVAGDSGADDNTAILFAYYDFLKAETVVEDEIVINGHSSGQIVELAKAKERELWGHHKPRRRVYDADKQLLIDIMNDHQYEMVFPRKDDRIAAIHELRHQVGAGKFKVKRRAQNLSRQMKVGMWKDEKHLDFQRSDALGHLDAIAAAIYLNRSIDTAHNPWPQNLGKSAYTHHITPTPQSSEGPNEKALASVFGGGSRPFKGS